MDYFKNMDNYELDRFHSVIFFILTVLLTGSGLFGDIYDLPDEKKIMLPARIELATFGLLNHLVILEYETNALPTEPQEHALRTQFF